MITVKIDVTKIDKARLFKGAKGTYLDLVLIETPGGKYGDYAVKQDLSKEDRAKGVKLPFIGNGKTMGGPRAPAGQQPASSNDFPDDPPF